MIPQPYERIICIIFIPNNCSFILHTSHVCTCKIWMPSIEFVITLLLHLISYADTYRAALRHSGSLLPQNSYSSLQSKREIKVSDICDALYRDPYSFSRYVSPINVLLYRIFLFCIRPDLISIICVN